MVIGKIVVGNGDGRGAMNGVNEAVVAVGEVAMVHPDSWAANTLMPSPSLPPLRPKCVGEPLTPARPVDLQS